jgi:hypothetical protein
VAFSQHSPKSLHEMNRAEFDACAAAWARQIAGSPAWWYTAFAVQALLSIGWVLLVCVGWGWLTPLARFITLTSSWGEIQVVYWAAVCVWALIVGSRPGGTFWRWWGTWLYLGIVLPALFLVIFVWWSPLAWKWRFLLGALAACVLALRTRVADLVFRATVCRDLHLRDIPAAPRHIFCATEMETGRHAYFSRDFIYSWGAGIGQPADLPLSTAVQVSANFPVAFPPDSRSQEICLSSGRRLSVSAACTLGWWCAGHHRRRVVPGSGRAQRSPQAFLAFEQVT